MSTILSHTIQPPLLSLFSSTTEPPLALFHTHTDAAHPRESFVSLVSDSAAPISSKTRNHVPRHVQKGSISHPVLHIQSPNIRATYVQAGGMLREHAPQMLPLGITLPWLHVQLRPLGRRPLAIEVGVADRTGTEGIIRMSTFQNEPRLHRRDHDAPAVLHLPLRVPDGGTTVLTPWLEVDVELAALLPLFRQMAHKGNLPTDEPQEKRAKREEVKLPSAQWGSVTYVRVYANCRLRRVWFVRRLLSADKPKWVAEGQTDHGRRTLNEMGKAVEDFALYAARPVQDST